MKYYLWNKKDTKPFIVKGNMSHDMVVGVVVACHKESGLYAGSHAEKDWHADNFVRISASEVHTIVKYIQDWIA